MNSAVPLARRRGAWSEQRRGRMLVLSGVVLFFAGLLPSACVQTRPSVEQARAAAPAAEDPLQAEMERNLATAHWMMDYDRVAWATTDLLVEESRETLKHVGPIWFGLQQDGSWYAVYGADDDGRFEIAVCYREVARGKFEKVPPPHFADVDRFARAIRLTRPAIEETTRRTTVRFNYYVRSEPDRIAVYYLPAFQTDGKLAYGIQHTFYLDPAAGTILAHDHLGDVLIGLFPNKSRVVTLEMPQCRTPTPQAMFTMMSYREQFEDIVTHCRDGYYKVRSQGGVWACVPAYTTAGSPSG